MKALYMLLTLLFFVGCQHHISPVKTSGEAVAHQKHNITINKKLYLDKEFSKEDLVLIKNVLHNWEVATDNVIHFDYVDNFDTSSEDYENFFNKSVLKKAKSTDFFMQYLQNEIKKLIAEQDGEEKDITLLGYHFKKESIEQIFIVYDKQVDMNGNFDARKFQSTVAHEVAHSLGMKHFDGGPSIMNTEFEVVMNNIFNTRMAPITYPTMFDLIQFCDIYFCKLNEMNIKD